LLGKDCLRAETDTTRPAVWGIAFSLAGAAMGKREAFGSPLRPY
jgi:hypothetical protein